MWDNGGSPTLSHLIFTGNFAQSEGGGLRVTSGAPLLLSCVFQGNSVGFGGKGGGIYAGGGSSLTAQGCVFRSNSISSSSTGGGGVETAGAPVTMINSIFAQNTPNGLQVASVDGSVVDQPFSWPCTRELKTITVVIRDGTVTSKTYARVSSTFDPSTG